MNFFLNIIMQATPEVADTLHKSAFREFLQTIKGMTGEQIIDMAIRGTLDAIVRIAIACVIFYVGRWIVRRLTTVIHKIFIKRDVEASLATFLLSLVNISMTFILIIIVISFLGIDTTSFIAIFASAGLAVGMALSGTLQNFAGGVLVLLLKPYRVGDFIEAQGQTGTVKAITLFSTVLATPDNKNIILPNGGMSTGIINNYSKENIRRVDWTFGIAYGDDYDKAKATIASLLEADDRVMKDPAYFIALGALADSSVNITVRAWVASEDYWGVFFDMNEKVYKTFPKEGLNIPFPQMDVHLDKN
ncbi:MAG: mechanosensitive ion channel protein MscS [Flavobacteriales bacterium]|nr:MAG: mechanosensitive ion channel protein MscS [Flavobacteriales bacterium]